MILSGFQSPFLNLKSISKILCDGNSITAGQSHATELATHEPFKSAQTQILNFGVSGQTTAQMLSDASSQVDPEIVPNKTIVIALEIGNHIFFGASAREAVDTFWEYCEGRRAAGAYVVACTLHTRWQATATLPSKAQYLAELDQANTLLRQEWRGRADALFDCRTVPECTVMSSRYFPDYIHPNRALDVLFTDALMGVLRRIPARE